LEHPSQGEDALVLAAGGETLVLSSGEKRIVKPNTLLEDALSRLRYGTCPDELRFRVFGEQAERALAEDDGLCLVAADQFLPVSLRENITLGSSSIEPSLLAKALSITGLDETVAKLPKGVETVLTDNGAPLSMADLARVAIARALLSPARVMLVDRVFDVLPLECAQACAEQLWASDRTIVCVTSRDTDGRLGLASSDDGSASGLTSQWSDMLKETA
jgi:hypothetical protein